MSVSLEAISTQIVQLQRTLVAQALGEDPAIWEKIKGQELAKRAILVAAVQKQPIVFFGPTGSSKSMLVCAAARLGVPAFELTTPDTGGTPAKLKAWMGKAATRRILARGQLFLEVQPPSLRDLSGRAQGTSLDDAKRQLARATPQMLQQLTASTLNTLDGTAATLLGQAQRELRLTPPEIDTVILTARSIAALEAATTILVTHVAEAVLYRNPIRILC